jgi:hypothetical protein
MADELWSERLYRDWYDRWWTTDYSVASFRERLAKYNPGALDLTEELPTYQIDGREFSALHLPYFDRSGHKTARFSLPHLTRQAIIQRVNGAMIGTGKSVVLDGATIDFPMRPATIARALVIH